MKKNFSRNTTEVFAKTIFHYVPEILKYIDEIKEIIDKGEMTKSHGIIFNKILELKNK